EVSRRNLLEHVDIEGLVGDQLLEPSVLILSFEFFEAFDVIGLHAPVLGHPAMPGRLCDLQMPAHLSQLLPGPEEQGRWAKSERAGTTRRWRVSSHSCNATSSTANAGTPVNS